MGNGQALGREISERVEPTDVESGEQRAESREQRAKSGERRAESQESRAELFQRTPEEGSQFSMLVQVRDLTGSSTSNVLIDGAAFYYARVSSMALGLPCISILFLRIIVSNVLRDATLSG